MRALRPASLAAASLLVTLALQVACSSSPWYGRYGFTAEEQLREPAAVPGLIRALRSDDVDDVQEAARALAQIGEPAARPLADEAARGSQAAVWALGELGPAAAPALPALIQALTRRERTMRQEAVQALGKLGSAARPALPALLAVLRGDSSRRVRMRVPDALVRLGDHGPAVRGALDRATHDSSHRVRHAAREALGRLGTAAAAAKPPAAKPPAAKPPAAKPPAAKPPAVKPPAREAAPILAVFDLEDAQGVLPAASRDGLTDYLATRLAASGRFKVVPRARLRERLVQQKTAGYRACHDERCQIELGKAVAAQRSLATRVLRVGPRCTITSMLYDLRTEATDRAASAQAASCAPADVMDALGAVARQLTTPPRP